ncbi:MAG: carboxypeptidase M32 [Pseudomonadota bacterium]
MSALSDLLAHQRETEALSQVMGRLGWDQETMMPRAAAPQRGEEMAALESVLHARRTDPRMGDWLAAADPQTDVKKAQVREIKRSYDRATKVPGDLASEIARVTSASQGIWAEARAADDFAAFQPTLERVVALKLEEAQAIAEGRDLYDAMLDDFEPGATGEGLAAMFAGLRPRLVALRDNILGAPAPAALDGVFDEDGQLEISNRLAEAFGYDFTRGRIDKAVHPFSSGSGLDVRITTRSDPADPFNCFYSTIHEVGHAAYEQSVDPDYHLTAIGQGASMGVHESQSRIYENQLGRSRAFTGYLFDQMRATFGDFGVVDADAFYATANRVQAGGLIRTEADEVQYNLHVLLRFDLERALVAGDLAVADLPGAWDDRVEADFGIRPSKPSLGCLQDVHWSVGLFGYFPTYSLGNVYAGCLHAALRRDLPDLDAALAQGDTSPATAWLGDKLQRFGALRTPVETIEHATGTRVSDGPLLDYLEEKFARIYKL